VVGELLPSYGDQEDPEAERSPVQGERDIHVMKTGPRMLVIDMIMSCNFER